MQWKVILVKGMGAMTPEEAVLIRYIDRLANGDRQAANAIVGHVRLMNDLRHEATDLFIEAQFFVMQYERVRQNLGIASAAWLAYEGPRLADAREDMHVAAREVREAAKVEAQQ